MLVCDKCEQIVSEGEEMNHVIEYHPTVYKDLLQEWIEKNTYEWDGSDQREEALTASERNPSLR
jgi:hypothetical protein